MKKIIAVIGVALAIALPSVAGSWGGVTYYTSASTAIANAQSSQKMLFILTGTSWCAHCTDLKNAIAELSSDMNANFVVYYCDADKDKTMPSSTGYPHWGIYNPYTFSTAKRWKNSDEYYEATGFSNISTLKSAIASAVSQWAHADKSGSGAAVTPTEEKSDDTAEKKETTPIATSDVPADLAFYIDMDEIPETLNGNTVLVDLLPTVDRPEAAVLTAKYKMTTGTAAKVSYSKRKGLQIKDTGNNLSGLKLTYTKKKSTFKGSFKIYTQTSRGTLRKLTVKFTDGKYADGVGTATGKITGLSQKFPVRLVVVDGE